MNTAPLKGHYRGECERQACITKDARWYNPHTNAHYCNACATTLNEELKWAKLIELRFV